MADDVRSAVDSVLGTDVGTDQWHPSALSGRISAAEEFAVDMGWSAGVNWYGGKQNRQHVHRSRLLGRGALAATLACMGLSSAVADTRGTTTGSTFVTRWVQTTNQSFATMTDLPVRRQILITSPDEGTVSVYTYDGILVETRVLPGKPGDAFVANGLVYLMFEGAGPAQGRLTIFDPATFATTNVITGLVSPRGLVRIGGAWYSTAGAGFDRRIVRMQPGTNTVVPMTTILDNLLEDTNRLLVAPDEPEVLYLQYRNAANPTLWTVNLTTQVVAGGPMSNGTWAFIPGQLITGNGGFGFGRPGLGPLGWSWGPDNSNFGVVGVAASADYVALWSQRQFYGDQHEISLHPVTGRWPEYHRTAIPDLHTDGAAMMITADGTRVVLYTVEAGFWRLTVAGGITNDGALAAPGSPSGRVSAPPAAGAAVAGGRLPAPRAAGQPVVQKGANDIEFDGAGRAYIADGVTHSVNVYDPHGVPLASFQDLDTIQQLVAHGGQVLGMIPRRAQIVGFDLARLQVDVRCTHVFGTTFTSYGSSLYSQSPFRRIDPATCAQYAFRPDPLTSPDVRDFSDGPNTVSILTRGRVTAFDGTGQPINSAVLFDPVPVPGLPTAIDGAGRRFDAATLEPDGRVFPGNAPAVSYETPRFVATSASNISLYQYDGVGVATPARAVSLPEPELVVVRYEFQPGTGNLWVIRRRQDESIRLDIVPASLVRGTSQSSVGPASVSNTPTATSGTRQATELLPIPVESPGSSDLDARSRSIEPTTATTTLEPVTTLAVASKAGTVLPTHVRSAGPSAATSRVAPRPTRVNPDHSRTAGSTRPDSTRSRFRKPQSTRPPRRST